MKRRIALPFHEDGYVAGPGRVPMTVERRRLLWLRFLFVMTWIVFGVALAVAALASR